MPSMYGALCVKGVGASMRRTSHLSTSTTSLLRRSLGPSSAVLGALHGQRRPCHGTSTPRNFEVIIAKGERLTGKPSSSPAPNLPSSVDERKSCRPCPHDGACPTAAILVDTDGDANVSLAYCATFVHDTVQAHLRVLLVEQLLAPLLTNDFHFEVDRSEEQKKMGEEETSYAAVEALAITTLAVHNALHSFRHVAFSSMAGPPLPPHRSWHPLWAAYRSHLLRSPHTAPSPGVLAETTSAGKTAGGDTAAAASTARLMDPAAVQRKFGEAKPLFGAAGRGTFFLVAIPPTEEDGDAADASAPSSYAASGAEHVHLSHRRHHDSRAAAVGLAGVPSSSSKTPPSSVSSLWECFRVDAYVPASVQMQAAVRHLLRERRPRSMYQPETVDKEGIPIDQRNPVKLSARPLAVIALVVPDTLVGAYTAFLQRLEHERADVRGRTGGGSVQLLLFNSAELVRVCHAA